MSFVRAEDLAGILGSGLAVILRKALTLEADLVAYFVHPSRSLIKKSCIKLASPPAIKGTLGDTAYAFHDNFKIRLFVDVGAMNKGPSESSSIDST